MGRPVIQPWCGARNAGSQKGWKSSLLKVPIYIETRLSAGRASLRSKRFRRVWEQRKTEERGFRYFACAENGARAIKRTVGVGEGKEGTACGQTPGF